MNRSRLNKAMVLCLVIPGLFAPVFVARGQDSEEGNVVEENGRKVIYKAKTEISFEGVDVEGEIKKPAGAYLLDRRKSKFSPLITFRTNFDREIKSSADEVK